MSTSEQSQGQDSTNSSKLSVAEDDRMGEVRSSSTAPSTNPSSLDLQQENPSLPQQQRRPRLHSWAVETIRRRRTLSSASTFDLNYLSRMATTVGEIKEVRVAVVGSAGVGKTSLIMRLLGNRQFTLPPPTTECSIHRRPEEPLSSRPLYIIGDTAGQHDGRPEISAVNDFVRELNPHVFLLCFLLGDDESLAELLVIWSRFVRIVAPNVPMLLVGLGSDQLVNPANGLWRINLVYKVQKLIRAADFIECSGLTGEGVDRILTTVHQLAQARVAQLEAEPPVTAEPTLLSSQSFSLSNPRFSSISLGRLSSSTSLRRSSTRLSSIKRLSFFSSSNSSIQMADENQPSPDVRRQSPISLRLTSGIASAIRIKKKSHASSPEVQQQLNVPGVIRKRPSLASVLSLKRWSNVPS